MWQGATLNEFQAFQGSRLTATDWLRRYGPMRILQLRPLFYLILTILTVPIADADVGDIHQFDNSPLGETVATLSFAAVSFSCRVR